ncbi:hypothetical protein Tco_0077744, partial [Tanacetum coccineum]
MSDLKFADTHNLVAFLSKLAESEGFEQIVKTVNGEVKLQALVDKKKVIITESTIRRDLQLEDAKGTDCLPNATIFEQLTHIGAKTTAWNEFSSTMASAIICLATNQKFNFSMYIFDNMVKYVDSMVKFWMYPRFIQVFMNKQVGDMSHHKRIYITPSHTKNVFGSIKRECKCFSGRVTPLFPTMMVQAYKEMGEGSKIPTDPYRTPTITQPSSSQPQRKQKSRKSKKKNTDVPQPSGSTSDVPDENVPTTSNDPLLSVEDRLKLTKLMDLCTNLQKSRELQGRKIADIDTDAKVTLIDETLGRNDDNIMFDTSVLDEQEVKVEKVVSTAEVTTDSATTTTVDELTLAQTLIEIKAAKPKVVTTAVTTATTTVTRTKARGVVFQEPNYELAARLQAQEQEELTIKERSKMFVELMDKIKKHFARLRAEEHNRSQMSTYLKHMAGYKQNQLKSKNYDEIQKLFDKSMTRVNMFVDIDTELVKRSSKKAEMAQESSSKRAGDELEQEKAKKQKINDDEAEMKKHMEIVPDDNVAIDATPLATKPTIIIDWKIIKEGNRGYFQIIRADGSSRRYSSMIKMLQSIDKEDLETLWKLVKAKYRNTRLKEGYKRVLWGDLKVMFKPDVESK